jgi:maltose operon periplasmic protein
LKSTAIYDRFLRPKNWCLAMSRAIALILLLLLLSSCAEMVNYRTAVDSFMDATPCCTSIAEFKYDPLPSDEPVTFRFDENSDSFVFPSGKSYFKAFRLPSKEIPYRIHVKSFALGEGIHSAHIFYPQIALLDDRFTVWKLSDPRDFVLKKAGFKETISVSWGMMLKLEGSMQVDIADARYLVIYTTKELMVKTSEYWAKRPIPIDPFTPGTVFLLAIPDVGLPVDIPHSPFGLISISVGFGKK